MLPFHTTTIDVLRVAEEDEYAEPYSGDDTERRDQVYTGVHAVISKPVGREELAGGEQSVWDFLLVCDVLDLNYSDTVRDVPTGVVYRVVWVMTYAGEHVEAGIRVVEGEV